MNPKIFKAFEKESRRHLTKIKEMMFEGSTSPLEMGADLSLKLSKAQLDALKFSALKLNDAAKIVSMDNILDLSEKIGDTITKIKLSSPMDTTAHYNAITSTILAIEAILSDIPSVTKATAETTSEKTDVTSVSPPPPFVPASEIPKTLEKTEIHQKILAAFEGEYKEHLETIRSFLESELPDDFENSSAMNDAFRAAHSLKGAARAVDLNTVSLLAHRLETLFSRVKEKRFTLDRKMLTLSRSVPDAIEDYVDLFFKGASPSPPTKLMETLDAALGRSSKKENAQLKHQSQPLSPVQAQPTLKVSAETLNHLQRSCSQLSALNYQEKELTDSIRCFKKEIFAFQDENNRFIRQLRSFFPHFESDTSYAPLARFTNWVDNQTRQLAKKGRRIYERQRRLHQNHDHLTQNIQEDLKSARMVPAQNAFEMLRKMVRDIASQEKKEIDFKIKGLNLKGDRLVFQQLKDPLIHLLRNALCHGIETPLEREKTGKSKVATIELEIKVIKNSLNIRVSDDGRGLDHTAIARKAVKEKLMGEDMMTTLSPSQIMELILRPGFSTTELITDLSGRGMGLSVVKKAMENLQGEINISSSPSEGTRFSLTVPLTILTHRVLLIQLKDQIISIPAGSIDQAIRVKTDRVKTIEGTSVIYDGKIPIPFISLNELLFDHGDISVTDEMIQVLIIHANHQRLAIAVTAHIDEREVIVQKLPIPFKETPFKGGFALADGTVCLILNPKALMQIYEKSLHKEVSFKIEEKSTKAPLNRILIVDDSITTRTLEKTILEAHGYQVTVAVDGRQALNLLMKIDVDLVITDVDMPVMTGFELIREMKAHDHLSQIPVIIVSSMERTQDREEGLQLGADAYIIKQKFEQQNLLQTIKQIL